jgi:hypothetical protein
MNAVLESENDSTVNSEALTDKKSANLSFSLFLYRLIAYADASRSIASFIFILFVIVISDTIFGKYLFVHYTELV